MQDKINFIIASKGYGKTYHEMKRLINTKDKEIEELKAQLEMYENGVYFSSENDKLQEEIERLNNDIKILLKENGNKEKVILKYDNIINELEKWLYEEYDATIFDYRSAIEDVLNKLGELKGSDKE